MFEDSRIVVVMSNSSIDPARAAFVQRMASALVDGGMASLPSRVWAALLVDEDGRMTSAELTATLGVSAGGISGAVRYLSQVGIVRREREPGSRRDVYVVDDQSWHDIMLRETQSMLPITAALAAGIADLPEDSAARQRLELSREFLEFLNCEICGIAERWQASRQA
jgi:DNA-binding transcriptional regulator GbsR (MarR family)